MWGAGNNWVYFASLPHTATAGKQGNACALVGRESHRICWTVTSKSCFHLPQLCFQLKGLNDMIMLVSEGNGNEVVQQHEAMKRPRLSALLPPHKGLAMFSVLMCQKESQLKGVHLKTRVQTVSVVHHLSQRVTTHYPPLLLSVSPLLIPGV